MTRRDKILIVDDNAANRLILVKSLQKTGYEVREATDGFEALDVAREWVPDLVLLDLNMPERDGFQVCEMLKSGEETAAIPVVFITAQSGAEDIERGFAVGGSDYVTKPFHMGEVKARVSVHLQLRRTERELQETHAELLQAQKLESIGQLAAGIAHEINTPTQYVGDNVRFLHQTFGDLAPIIDGSRELVGSLKSGTDCTDGAGELATRIEKAGWDFLRDEIPSAFEDSLSGLDRVSEIVRAMKDFSHPSSKEKTNVDVNATIRSTITVASGEWKYVAEVVTDFAEDMPLVPCLPGELNQVVLNMIVNAAHAIADAQGESGAEKGRITISTRQDGDHAEIRVADTGTGIPVEARERIFDPFFTTKEVGKGTGQGLSIAHSVVVGKHGGTLTFETELGEGTTFVIRLPLEANAGTEAEAA